ncbi:unnamed protein product [Urochloa decumbens]|uniref:Uncharacterized protein n=1 Tax=Urochloa decumbens TaxID=240449 RepID=A0ABC9ASZ1_9POAL
MAAQTVVPSDEELLQAQADLWRHSLCYLTPFALRCAVELGIPTAIHRLGRAASPSDLITALSLPSVKLPFLRRLLRLLGAAGIFTVDKSTEEEMYCINPESYLLVDGIPDEVHINHTSLVLAATSKRHIDAAMGLADWFKKDVVTPPFEELHGATLFHESLENLDPDYHKMVNEALHAHDNFGIPIAMREFSELFKGIQSVTYCCGASGDDAFAKALVKAFPQIKCTVLAYPKMIDKKQADGLINYVEGDMFSFIPPAQAVWLQLVLHHYTDEDCVKILAQCRKAIHSPKDGGKVIIGDIVIDYSPGPMLETHLLMDVEMMTMAKGRQRDEKEWREIFMKAGFSDYKLVKKLGARGVFEVYP